MKVSHPHITTNQSICNNSPIITGTRTTVRSIVTYYKDGLSPEEIIAKLPYLTLSEVYDTISFYYDNKSLIDNEIIENNNEKYWEKEVVNK
ncbi:MAG: DUF433 domain-containing protein [Spirochaetes bacterium]|nr:DUF433 domain-containing protein [Spirochaetota bacterium]